jgi:hypothetical protein
MSRRFSTSQEKLYKKYKTSKKRGGGCGGIEIKEQIKEQVDIVWDVEY